MFIVPLLTIFREDFVKTKDWRIEVLSNLKKDVFDYRYIDEQLINEITFISQHLTSFKLIGFAYRNVRYAIEKEPIIKLILRKNFKSIDKENNWTALQCAAYKGYYATTRSLIENGADVNFKQDSSLSALDLACIAGCIDIVYLLLQHGAIVTRTTLSTCNDIQHEININKRKINQEIIADLVRNAYDTQPIHTRSQ